MSDNIKHECGIALVRLRKPLEHYQAKYGTCFTGLNKLYLLMEKQHNRGQDGAGVACVKFNVPPGTNYIYRKRSVAESPIGHIYKELHAEINEILTGRERDDGCPPDFQWIQRNAPFCGELFLGHLRYGTYGKNSVFQCHPLLRESNWPTRTLFLAGNFNLTNVSSLFNILVDIGQHPMDVSDTVTILEKIGHYLDEENTSLLRRFRKTTELNKRDISSLIAQKMDIPKILTGACSHWDGGYVVAGLIGHGDAFVIRDPSGIRPAYYYADDEFIAVTSERPPLQTAFDAPTSSVQEVPPGHAIIIKKDGSFSIAPILKPMPKRSCSFERIYFSRGSDADIYQERKALGRLLTPKILDSVGHDLENTVFSYIPNTAETCFYGMVEAMRDHCDAIKRDRILALGSNIDKETIEAILSFRPRFEKVAVKDAKLRTFITSDSQRKDLVAHVYDITYGSIRPGLDTLVVIDDSIVRGTTIRESILRILDRLSPKKIVLASSAPQIRYPDCYGIDMSRLGEFVAFRAAVELLKSTGRAELLKEVYARCVEAVANPSPDTPNHVKAVYEPFTDDQVSDQVSRSLRPDTIKAEFVVVYQTVDGLRQACPEHTGDWYFTGDYPTPGGNMVANQAFINFIDSKTGRAYDC